MSVLEFWNQLTDEDRMLWGIFLTSLLTLLSSILFSFLSKIKFKGVRFKVEALPEFSLYETNKFIRITNTGHLDAINVHRLRFHRIGFPTIRGAIDCYRFYGKDGLKEYLKFRIKDGIRKDEWIPLGNIKRGEYLDYDPKWSCNTYECITLKWEAENVGRKRKDYFVDWMCIRWI